MKKPIKYYVGVFTLILLFSMFLALINAALEGTYKHFFLFTAYCSICCIIIVLISKFIIRCFDND